MNLRASLLLLSVILAGCELSIVFDPQRKSDIPYTTGGPDQACGTPDFDLDYDGIPNVEDEDDDGDGLIDIYDEDCPCEPAVDGGCGWDETTTEPGVGECGEPEADPDGDGILNFADTDDDGDGLADVYDEDCPCDPSFDDVCGGTETVTGTEPSTWDCTEPDLDADGDGIPNRDDIDDDGDGVVDADDIDCPCDPVNDDDCGEGEGEGETSTN